MPTWNADLYLQYANERTQPSLDLISRIQISNPTRIIDLGCGPGNSTALLRQRWTQADIIGLDRSVEMIEVASKAYPTEKWVLADATQWIAESPFDLVFSNAALHWLPNHAHLFPHLLAQVASSGALAVQMPTGTELPLRQVVFAVANDPVWSHLMVAARRAIAVETPSFYYDLLQPLTSQLEIWETEYYHVMDSHQAILNWFRGTGLRPFLEALENEEQKQRFQQLVLEGYRQAYPPQKDGCILFPFRRLFIIAYP